MLARPSKAMNVGGLTHAGLRDTYLPSTTKSFWDIEVEERNADEETQMQAGKLVRDYRKRYIRDGQDQEWKVLSAELPISFPIFDKDIPVYYSGTADALIEVQDRLWLGEHKTSASMSSTVILHYAYSPQVYGYLKAIQEGLTRKLDGVCINLIVKTKETGFHREYVPVNQLWMEQWERATKRMIYSLVHSCLRQLNGEPLDSSFPQNRYNCVPYFGAECPFRLVCWHSNGHLSDAIKQTYIQNDKKVTTEQLLEVEQSPFHSLSL
jgi:hypothetical protein